MRNGDSSAANGGASGPSGFYTTREADDEYKIRGCQDEDEEVKGSDKDASLVKDTTVQE